MTQINLETFDGLAYAWTRGLLTEAELITHLERLLADPESHKHIHIGQTMAPTLQFSWDVDTVKNEPEADRLVFDPLSKLLGRKIMGAKLGGYWIIGEDKGDGWEPLYGHRPYQTKARKLGTALARALPFGIVCTIEIKGA